MHGNLVNKQCESGRQRTYLLFCRYFSCSSFVSCSKPDFSWAIWRYLRLACMHQVVHVRNPLLHCGKSLFSLQECVHSVQTPYRCALTFWYALWTSVSFLEHCSFIRIALSASIFSLRRRMGNAR